MAKGITVSCNAYFAQLGALRVGAKNLLETAQMFGIDARAEGFEPPEERIPHPLIKRALSATQPRTHHPGYHGVALARPHDCIPTVNGHLPKTV